MNQHDTSAVGEKPVADPDSEAFWEATSRHELSLQRCKACNNIQFYPRAICTSCHSMDLEYITASGRAQVYSYTVIRRPPSSRFADRVPYVVALVDLEEGPRMMTNIVGAGAERVSIGDSVVLTWNDIADGSVALPVFELSR